MKVRKMIIFTTFLRYLTEVWQALTSWKRCNKMINEAWELDEGEKAYPVAVKVISKTFNVPLNTAYHWWHGVNSQEPNQSLALRAISECDKKARLTATPTEIFTNFGMCLFTV